MKSDDEFVNIEVTNSRTNHIKDPELKEELKKIKQFNLRVTRIILNSGEEEIVNKVIYQLKNSL